MRILLSILFSLYFTSALAYYWPNRYYGVYDFEVDGIYYVINSPDSTEVWVWHGAKTEEEANAIFTYAPKTYYTGDVEIPEYVSYNNKSYHVTQIGFWAFIRSTELHSVKLPNSIYNIGAGAFYCCENLTHINWPAKLKRIDDDAFYECKSLNIDWDNMPKSIMFIGNSFYGVETKEKIVLPDSLWWYTPVPAEIIEFGHNIPILSYCFLPSFNSHDLSRCTHRATNETVLPKSKFMMEKETIYKSAVKRIILPEVDSIMVMEPGIVECKSLTEFISYNPIPPAFIEHPNGIESYSPFSQWTTSQPTEEYTVKNGWLDDYSGVTLIVPTGSEEAYRNAPVWCNFENIKGVDDIDAYRTAGLDDLFKDEWDAPEIITTETGITINVWQPERVTIYSVNGMQIYNDVVNESASVNLANGFYIVRAGTHSIKVKI